MTRRGGVLLILDGWGHAPPERDNAIAEADTPVLDDLLRRCPTTLLDASGSAVGLPDGVVGNSEIGHLAMGAGRPLTYDSLLVQQRVESGELRADPVLRELCEELRRHRRALHLVGLCSDGRIHSDLDHSVELLRAAADAGLTQVWLHAITDGRDVADGTAATYLTRWERAAASVGVGRYATVIGRNYAMDKSGDAELTAAACRLLVDAHGHRTTTDAVAAADGADVGDAWLPPTLIDGEARPYPGVRDGDVILFANFRSDRTAPLVDTVADSLSVSGRGGVRLVGLTQYDTRVAMPALVSRADASGGLADALEDSGARSVRIAEHEKFEHVTFFLNGRDARRRTVEEHVAVPNVSTDYTVHPEMNIAGIADRVGKAAARDDVALVVANLANIDVVGHTGDHEATVRATEAVDRAVRHICSESRESGRWVLLVGDHGNGEQMSRTMDDGTRQPYGGHTTNQVPCVLVPASDTTPRRILRGGRPRLPSIAPTILDLLGLPRPDAMSEPSLFDALDERGIQTSSSVTARK
ncbi:2,3-bisphosphoglycerate-independent phosphoglycerate mutase [Saccharomonospora saliphila]|uniref:2,3-bisphosphoglycerate-independent phosphoglycerate mutase n=1 Tax=Saccharomonospora saliphila TaxID=369829 RepID=UPI0003789715|nr:2,3-bisphosphoglycerate-independent phosphoglycerate mutase [Saccharomonospora saliphila]